MARGLVFMHDLLIGDAVDNAGGLLEHLQGDRLVTAFDRLTDFFDGGPQGGPQTDVVSATFLALFRAFSSLLRVCHGYRGTKNQSGIINQFT